MEKAGLSDSQTAEPTTIATFTSLRCSRPTHSSKPFVYTEGLERLRRRLDIYRFLRHFGPKTDMGFVSLCRKCFRLVSEQRKTEERDSWLWPRER